MPDLDRAAIRQRVEVLRTSCFDNGLAGDARLLLALASAGDVPALLTALEAAEQDVERERQRADRAEETAAELQRRISGALTRIAREPLPLTPGRIAVLLQDIRLLLEAGRDRQEVPS